MSSDRSVRFFFFFSCQRDPRPYCVISTLFVNHEQLLLLFLAPLLRLYSMVVQDSSISLKVLKLSSHLVPRHPSPESVTSPLVPWPEVRDLPLMARISQTLGPSKNSIPEPRSCSQFRNISLEPVFHFELRTLTVSSGD